MSEERLYTKSELEHEKTVERVTTTLTVFTDTFKNVEKKLDTKMDSMETKVDNIAREMITRMEVDKKLEGFVRKEEVEPLKKFIYAVIATGIGMITTLIVGIVSIVKYASQ